MTTRKSVQSNCTIHTTYRLPTVEWKVPIKQNSTDLVIHILGGSSSASFDSKSIIGGGCGGSVIAKFVNPNKNDDIVIKLGLGGGFVISDNEKCVKANPGQDSILSVNGQVVAIAHGAKDGSGGGTTLFGNEYCTFKTSRGQDGSIGKRGISSYGDLQSHTIDGDMYFDLNDYDGTRGNGGLGVIFGDNAKYLGAGSHGYAKSWQSYWYFYCTKCYKEFYTRDSFEQHSSSFEHHECEN